MNKKMKQRREDSMWFMSRISVFGRDITSPALKFFEILEIEDLHVFIPTVELFLGPERIDFKIPHEVFFSDASLKGWARADMERQQLEARALLAEREEAERRELERLKAKYE